MWISYRSHHNDETWFAYFFFKTSTNPAFVSSLPWIAILNAAMWSAGKERLIGLATSDRLAILPLVPVALPSDMEFACEGVMLEFMPAFVRLMTCSGILGGFIE